MVASYFSINDPYICVIVQEYTSKYSLDPCKKHYSLRVVRSTYQKMLKELKGNDSWYYNLEPMYYIREVSSQDINPISDVTCREELEHFLFMFLMKYGLRADFMFVEDKEVLKEIIDLNTGKTVFPLKKKCKGRKRIQDEDKHH